MELSVEHALANKLKHVPHFYFLSSTSTNSASTTSSFFFDSAEGPAPAPGAGPEPSLPGAAADALYIASANLWLAVVSLSVAALISSVVPPVIAFLVSAM